jgi:hypothetical protein
VSTRAPESNRGRTKNGWLLTAVLASSLISLIVASMVPDAEAQRGRRGTQRRRGATAAAAPQEAPESAAIAPALEEAGIRWGVSPRESFDLFTKQLQERYRPRIAKAPGAIEEDRLRSEMQAEQQRMRRTFVRFTGQATGWDSSFLRDEYTHGNNEAMLIVREEEFHATSHYFFINERLWKRYQAYDASAFGGATFDQFAAAIQRRFGPGVERTGSLVEGRPPRGGSSGRTPPRGCARSTRRASTASSVSSSRTRRRSRSSRASARTRCSDSRVARPSSTPSFATTRRPRPRVARVAATRMRTSRIA